MHEGTPKKVLEAVKKVTSKETPEKWSADQIVLTRRILESGLCSFPEVIKDSLRQDGR